MFNELYKCHRVSGAIQNAAREVNIRRLGHPENYGDVPVKLEVAIKD